MDPMIIVFVVLVVVFPLAAGVTAYVLAKKKERVRLAELAASRPPRPGAPVSAASPQRPPATVEELGPVVQRYTTNNNRRAVTALACIAGGVIELTVTVPFTIAMIESGAPSNPCSGIVVGVGVAAFGIGVVLGLVSWFRRGETFDVHERGLVRHYAGRPRNFVAWSQIADVRPTPYKEGWFARTLGREGHTRLLLHGGGSIVVTGFTTGAEFLVNAVERAVFHGETPGAPSVPCTICQGTGRFADESECDVCRGTGRSTRSGRDVVG